MPQADPRPRDRGEEECSLYHRVEERGLVSELVFLSATASESVGIDAELSPAAFATPRQQLSRRRVRQNSAFGSGVLQSDTKVRATLVFATVPATT